MYGLGENVIYFLVFHFVRTSPPSMSFRKNKKEIWND